MSLDWKEVECPDCGQIGHVAAASGNVTEVSRYRQCLQCRPPKTDGTTTHL